MTRTNRKVLISLSIVILVVLNIWHWLPESVTLSGRVGQVDGGFSAEDFEVKSFSADSLPPMSRDIFYPAKVVVLKSLPKKNAPAAAPLPPVKSPGELARDNAQSEFSQIRCVGISVRNERIHAYLITASDSLLVSTGDKVGGRFVVVKIVPDGVTLKDPDTGVGGLISVSGK